MIGVFLSFDIVLFYVFFELTLVPLFFLIGIWGGPQRQYAARKFFIYTLAGSLITLLGVFGAVLAVANDPYAPADAGDGRERDGERADVLHPALVELVHGHTADLTQDVDDRPTRRRAADEFDPKKTVTISKGRRTGWRSGAGWRCWCSPP